MCHMFTIQYIRVTHPTILQLSFIYFSSSKNLHNGKNAQQVLTITEETLDTNRKKKSHLPIDNLGTT